MQIAGHQALDYAVETKRITAQQSQSVHLETYTQVGIARIGVSCPMARLKQFLDKCIKVDLDYVRLKRAARIVLEHTRREGDAFTSGWHTNRRKHTAQMLERLNC